MSTVTLVFTDLVSSTAVKALLPGEDARERNLAYVSTILDPHRARMEAELQRYGGRVISTAGDGYFLEFGDAVQAVRWAAAMQVDHRDRPIPTPRGPVELRIGIHTGAPIRYGDDWIGEEVDYAARVSGLGGAGQVLLSEATAALVRAARVSGLALYSHGKHPLKGIGPVEITELLYPGREPAPLQTRTTAPTNLPEAAAPFIGRSEELEDLLRRLTDPETRLLTLTGMGGMGKTRNALEAARLCLARRLDSFPDGVWWVPLEEARSGEAVFPRIAHHLRIPLEPQPSEEEQVLRYLRDRRLLLVLDNTEQIPDVGRALLTLQEEASGVRLLVTTRRATGIPTERVVEVAPLADADATALFADRARARNAAFELTDQNWADVAQLCRRLENLPLALELAASRTLALTPREILDRLDQPLRLLQVRDPDRPARQSALRAALDWSFELLSEEDRALFTQLSVFHGGFTLDEAEAVCDVAEVLEGVLELRRHSLLLSETDPASQRTRYRMVEAVREYAAGRLGGESPVHRSHARHFLRLAESAAEQDRTPAEAAALQEAAASFDNLLAALRWAHQEVSARPAEDSAGLCARLTLALGWFLRRRGFFGQSREITRRALAAVAETAAPALTARLVLQEADLTFDMGTLAEARELVERSLALLPEGGEPETRARALNLLGLIAWRENGWAVAREYLLRSGDLFRSLGHESGVAMSRINLGVVHYYEGNADEARRLYEEGREICRRVGDRRGTAEVELNRGVLEHTAGDLTAAYRHYRENLRVMEDLGSQAPVGVALNNIGEVLEAAGNPGFATQCYSASVRILAAIGSNLAGVPREGLQRLGRNEEPVDPLRVAAAISAAPELHDLPNEGACGPPGAR